MSDRISSSQIYGRVNAGELDDEKTQAHESISEKDIDATGIESPPTDDQTSHNPRIEPTTSDQLPKKIDRYEIIRLLGSGGFGAVYLANDELLRRHVSIKLPHRRHVRTANQIQSYINEAMMVAQLDHPKVVPVYDVGKLPDGLCYVVSKYIESETLTDRIRRSLTPVEAIETSIDLAETLQHIHEAGIVHRDMKPSNVLISGDGTHYVNDFGLAMIEVVQHDRGVLIGTPAYMSPEQASGEGHLVDGRSDVFSLGVMLYEMLAGRRPFRGRMTEQVIYQIRHLDPKPLRQLNRELPVTLERVCQKALAKQASRRYSSAIEFAEDLRQIKEQWDDLGSGAELVVASDSRGSQQEVSSNSVSGTATSGREANVIVIPKGLRSYDQQDAAFFQAMLPGPYDLDGCPESILFWKNRIDPPSQDRQSENRRTSGREIDPFRVGVIYGTSGCGKSSFIRAGLIPLLGKSIRVCAIDANGSNTIARLNQAIARQIPTFENVDDDDFSVVTAALPSDGSGNSDPELDQEKGLASGAMPLDRRLASIRRGENLNQNDKVLIVIDQFEQWLNNASSEEREMFVRALRQCDGHRLQAILLVRDDFWLATSRLMSELDIELSASHNLAMIDLLDKDHAAKLLRMLGRAYGRLGEDGLRLRREQRQFVREAVDALASGDRVVAVQLALFAEMMKTRPWNRATLRSLSGIDRVVEQFLHESFDSQSAPNNQRIHRQAAHRLLGAMLPETGLIRGGSVELSELACAAGYSDKPDAMDDLIRVLDSRLKLITPVEGETTSPVSPKADARVSENRYQLTHDSLIPAVRRWLAKHQDSSMTGRAKIHLKSRSQAWAEGQEHRQLPSILEWVQFSALVRTRQRSPIEQQMMKAANRKHGRSIGIVTVLSILAALAGIHLRDESRSDRLLSQLSIATAAQLPHTLNEIESNHEIVIEKLKERIVNRDAPPRSRFLAVLATPGEELSPAVDDKVVTDYLMSAKLELVGLARKHRPGWSLRFRDTWIDAISDETKPSGVRLRAGFMLASESNDQQTQQALMNHAGFLANAVVDESLSNKLSYVNLIDLATPIRNELTPELVSISWDANEASHQDAAISLIRDLNVDDPVKLIDVAMDLNQEEFGSILASVDLSELTAQQIEHLVDFRDDAPMRGRRAGRAVALSAVAATSSKAMQSLDWANKTQLLVATDHDDVGSATLIHSLMPLGLDAKQLLSAEYERNSGLRFVQLLALGEALNAEKGVDDTFRSQCRSLARDRFQSDSEPSVFSAARWLLIRLGDRAWVREELRGRVERVVDGSENASSRVRINAQLIPMVRFAAGSIAATSANEDAEPLPYEIEVATDEVTVNQFIASPLDYYNRPELKSQENHIPVGVIPWERAVEYCQWLTLEDGMTESDLAYETNQQGESVLRHDYRNRRGYRLPTAREWVAIWDADPARTAAVMDDALVKYYAHIAPFSGEVPEPVGGVKPDRNGMFHLAGNAEEWCSDRANQNRALRGIFYGWGLEERHKITEPHWVPGKINYIRIGFRVMRSTARDLENAD